MNIFGNVVIWTVFEKAFFFRVRKCYRNVERNELFSHVKKYHRVWRTYRCMSVKMSHLHSCIDLARNKYCLRGLFLTRQKIAIILPSINRRNSTQIYSYFSSVLDNLIMPITCRALSGLRQWKPFIMKCNSSPKPSHTVDIVHEKVDQNCVRI